MPLTSGLHIYEDLPELHQNAQKEPVEIGFLDSHCCIMASPVQGWFLLLAKGNRDESLPGPVYETLKSQVRLWVKGNILRAREGNLLFDGNTNFLFQVEGPWSCLIERPLVPRPGGRYFPGNIGEYFQTRRVGLFGSAGTGKSCLARALSNHLSIHFKISADVPYEFASTFIARYGVPTYRDQLWIFLKQWAREEDIALHKQVMISDCPHPLVYVYSRAAAVSENLGLDKTIPWMHEMALKGLQLFQHKVFLPFNSERCREDGIRIHNPQQSQIVSSKIHSFLEESGQPFLVFDGNLEGLISEILCLSSPHFLN